MNDAKGDTCEAPKKKVARLLVKIVTRGGKEYATNKPARHLGIVVKMGTTTANLGSQEQPMAIPCVHLFCEPKGKDTPSGLILVPCEAVDEWIYEEVEERMVLPVRSPICGPDGQPAH